MATHVIRDEEFGEVTVRRSRQARRLTLRLNPKGGVHIGLPFFTPLYIAKQFLQQNRDFVQQKLAGLEQKRTQWHDGDLIGKSHTLRLITGSQSRTAFRGTDVMVTLPTTMAPHHHHAQNYIHTAVLKALRKQASAHIPHRVSALATTHDFRYSALRFSNAGTRWGSCSSRGTLSFNIWLMQLPFELIDYVIVHELCHTRHMNHSPQFWHEVEKIVPDYKTRRAALKQLHPM